MRRIAGAILVTAALGALAGCDVQGSFVVDAQDVVDVDVVVTPSDADVAAGWGPQTCARALTDLGANSDLRLELVSTDKVLFTCVISGRMPLSELGRWSWLTAYHGQDRYVVSLPPGFLLQYRPDSLRIELTLPGPVESANGAINGSRVVWTDVAAARDDGLTATGRAPDPYGAAFGWALAGAGGLVVGLVAAGIRRRRRRGVGPDPAEPEALPTACPVTEDDAEDDDPRLWAPDDQR